MTRARRIRISSPALAVFENPSAALLSFQDSIKTTSLGVRTASKTIPGSYALTAITGHAEMAAVQVSPVFERDPASPTLYGCYAQF